MVTILVSLAIREAEAIFLKVFIAILCVKEAKIDKKEQFSLVICGFISHRIVKNVISDGHLYDYLYENRILTHFENQSTFLSIESN